jgi:hypothetical protein
MSTILTALAVIGFIAFVVSILVFIHRRDQKRDAAKNSARP